MFRCSGVDLETSDLFTRDQSRPGDIGIEETNLGDLDGVEGYRSSPTPDENRITRDDTRFFGRRPRFRNVETRVKSLSSSLTKEQSWLALRSNDLKRSATYITWNPSESCGLLE
jgi:hypothetical protein